MTSAITFAFQLLADHPEILAKVRAEQDALRGHDVDAALDLDVMDKMTYTRAVMKESLRLRPPVIMVPYATTKPFQISEDYTVPAGSMVIPSFWCVVSLVSKALAPLKLTLVGDWQELFARPDCLPRPGRVPARTVAGRW
jgi:hypothetical protein